MPQRFLRPGITTSDAWNAVSFEAQSLYIRIMTIVDDFGRCDARVPILHGQCFALRPDIKLQRTAALRSELHENGLIRIYIVNSKEFLQVLKWEERIRAAESKFPEPPIDTAETQQLLDIPQHSAADRSIPQRKDASLASTPSPSPYGNGGHSETELRLGRLFRRKDSTRWSPEELKTLRKLEPIPEEELKAIETYYGAKMPETSDYRRRDLKTLLNNWSGELDRARKVKINTGF